MLKRRTLMTSAMAAAIPGVFLPQARAQAGKNTLTIGMPLEPPGLDPTSGAASAIAEITQYNIFETLTKVNADGSVTPMLAESWSSSTKVRWCWSKPAATSVRCRCRSSSSSRNSRSKACC